MKDRLTWDEIQSMYPHQFVYMTDVERGQDNPTDIITAVVALASNERVDEYDMRTYEGDYVRRYTSPGETLPLGALML